MISISNRKGYHDDAMNFFLKRPYTSDAIAFLSPVGTVGPRIKAHSYALDCNKLFLIHILILLSESCLHCMPWLRVSLSLSLWF